MQDLKITIIQADLDWENTASNIQKFENRIKSIEESVDLIILPETFSTAFTMNAQSQAETMDGPTITWLHKLSGQYNVDIVGTLIIKDNDKFYNRCIWIKPDGKMFIYDKRHLFRMAGESNIYTSGAQNIEVELNGWKIRPLICYDLRFPVWARNIGGNTYDLLIYMANWPEARIEHWKTLLKARAIENQCYVAGVTRLGKDNNNVQYCGDSMIIDPFGKTLVHLGNEESSATQILSIGYLDKYRQKFPAWQDADKFKIIDD